MKSSEGGDGRRWYGGEEGNGVVRVWGCEGVRVLGVGNQVKEDRFWSELRSFTFTLRHRGVNLGLVSAGHE